MKSMSVLAVMAVMAGMMAHGASADPAEDRRVTVCMEAGGGLTVIPLAEMIATKMFRGIGVNLFWHPSTYSCPSDGIFISLSYRTPSTLKPGALAYAKPYEGTHIVLLYDRIVEMWGSTRVAPLLSHVLVHEITHILEGIARHSEGGVMKARWTSDDFSQMIKKSMGFDRVDIELIHAGMAARSRRVGGTVAKTFAME
jgi:hypothetical protein